MLVNDFAAGFKSAQVNASKMDLEILSLVSAEDNDRLLQSIHDSEIKEAISQMDKFKAPGPNGFGAAFFQDYWHIVKEKACTVVRSFFKEGKPLK